MLDILRRMADEVEAAVKLIPSYDERGKTVCMGADGTPTSQIDKIAENTILKFIQLNKIKLNVLSEEIGFVDNGFSETLILDPIDGTTNSSMGVPLYTISMAVGKKSMNGMRVALIRNLVTGEEFTAEKGKGSFFNGKKLKVKKKFNPKKSLMMIYLGSGSDPKAYELAKRVKSSRAYGCASLEMSYVASGKADGFYMNAENHNRAIRIVDIAASALILREAGGEIYDLEGNVLDMPFDVRARANFVAVGCYDVYDYVMNGKIPSKESGKKYGIYANTSIAGIEKVAEKVIKALDGEKYVLDADIAKLLGRKGTSISKMDVDIVIVLGGDGTVLRALSKTDALVIGVNAGDVGFLTEIEINKISDGIKKLKKGDYKVQRRPKISVSCDGKAIGEAVNEAVIHTDTIAKIRRFRIYVNGSLATDMRSDGIMLSTPTGSTCYAMSLGSPTIDYGVDAWVLVPMAAFKYSARPMVVPSSSTVIVETVLDKGCVIVLDGQKEVRISGGSKVEISKSPKYASFIVFDTNFYSRVRDKLVNKL